jgi:hypothetical protein
MYYSSSKRFRIAVALVLVIVIFSGFVQPGGVSSVEAAQTVALPAQAVAPGEATLTVNLELPAGCKFNQEAPSTLSLKSKDVNIAAVDVKYAQNQPMANLPLSLTVPVKEGKTTLEAKFRVNYCDEKLGICFLKEAVLNLPVEVNKQAANKKLEIVYKVPAN